MGVILRYLSQPRMMILLVDVASKYHNPPPSITLKHTLQLYGLAITEPYDLCSGKSHAHCNARCQFDRTSSTFTAGNYRIFILCCEPRHVPPTFDEVIRKLALVPFFPAEHLRKLLIEGNQIGRRS